METSKPRTFVVCWQVATDFLPMDHLRSFKKKYGISWFTIAKNIEPRRGDKAYLLKILPNGESSGTIVASGVIKKIDCPFGPVINKQDTLMVDIEWKIVLDGYPVPVRFMEEGLNIAFPMYDWSGKTDSFVLDDKTAELLDKRWAHYLSHNKFGDDVFY